MTAFPVPLLLQPTENEQPRAWRYLLPLGLFLLFFIFVARMSYARMTSRDHYQTSSFLVSSVRHP